MLCFAGALMAAAVSGCSQAKAGKISSSAAPSRIVSMDFCADQYALELMPREHILALSPDAVSNFSYHRARAENIPTVRARAEDILALNPDMVIRSYGGGPGAARLFERAGIPVINIDWANQIGGDDIGSVAALMRDVAGALGQTDKGEALIADYKARLQSLRRAKPVDKSALYMTPYGVTTGPGTLIDDMMSQAGLENFQTRAGWQPLPLERLTRAQPDHIITGFFDTHNSSHWSIMRHPIARRLIQTRPVTQLDGAWTSCGAWFLMDAVEAIHKGARP